jgi:hypothetical protein
VLTPNDCVNLMRHPDLAAQPEVVESRTFGQDAERDSGKPLVLRPCLQLLVSDQSVVDEIDALRHVPRVPSGADVSLHCSSLASFHRDDQVPAGKLTREIRRPIEHPHDRDAVDCPATFGAPDLLLQHRPELFRKV